MNMHNFKLALSMMRRDWRAGEWRVLLIALVLAVGSISTVGLFSDRVRQALKQESHSLLGADLRINSIRPIPQAYRDAARQRGLRIASTSAFPSMVSHDNDNMLCEIQAIETGYPLRGKVMISETNPDGDSNHDAGHIAASVPAAGTTWVDERLIRRMGLNIGDEISLGKLHLSVAARVIKDVDQAVSFASMAPRIQINLSDLLRSGLVQEGSRINYRLLVAGNAKQVESFRQWANEQIKPGEKIEDVRDARPEIRQAMERAEHFLGLAALMTFVLAGVAMALAARQFIHRHLDSCAVMRCLGASQQQVLNIFLLQFVLLGLLGILTGSLIGWGVQALLVSTVETLSTANLPQPGILPLLQATASGMALLLGFTFLPLWQLKSVSALRVLRRELGLPTVNTGMMYGIGAIVLVILFVWQAGSVKLGATVLAGLATGLFLFGLIAWLTLHILAALPTSKRQIFANLARHGKGNAIQIVALSLGGMSLLLLTLVRTELMQNWQERLPPDTPNRFIVNVQPDQRDAVLKYFSQQGLEQPRLYPMVRGRLVAINNKPIKSEDYPDARARALVERETNLSWNADIPQGNLMQQGKWWTAPDSHNELPPEISLEEGLANTLGIALEDMLTYDIGGSEFTAKVINLRKVRWDSMQVNFFVITQPGLLDNYPTSYLSSYYLPPAKLRAGDGLLKAFPNLLIIDTEAIINQVRRIMDQIAQTLGAVFLFTLLSGLSVLYAALIATQDDRIHQSAILRTLGADTRYLRNQHLSEFAVLGALSGLFAALGSAALGWVLARNVLEIPFSPPPALWLAGVSGGMCIVMLSGWLVTRKVVKLPPLQVLAS